MATKEVHDRGHIDDKGHWRPERAQGFAPLFTLPFRPIALLKWLFGWGGYIWPIRVIYVVLAYVTWYLLQGGVLETYKSLEFGWIALIVLRNLILLVTVFGFYHVTIYMLKVEKSYGKYHPDWQIKDSKRFLFHDQVKDNMFRSIVSGVPIWSAWEVLYLWLAANGRLPLTTYSQSPVWFVSLFFIIPLWREVHFYFIHRLLHWKPLLKAVHSVHHKNPNCGPWSGMAMHPIEHIGYLSVVLLAFILPVHPVHLFFISQLTALRPAHGHTGFEGPFFKGKWPAGDYFHYLHHKHVSCNYGESTVPLDRWFGTFFDGEGTFRRKGK